jgi:hypothetical protein
MNNNTLIKEFRKLNDELLNQVKDDFEKNQNRKSSKTKEDVKDEIRHQITYILYAVVGVYFSYHFFRGYRHLADGFDEVLNGNCFPSLFGKTNPTDHLTIISNLLGSFGGMFTKTFGSLFSNSVCEFFRKSSKVIFTNFIGALSGNGDCISILVGTATKIAFPFAIKKVIDATVDGVFKCFEDPKYAAKVKADADKFIKEEDEKLKSKKIKGFSFIGEELDED